MVVPARRRLHSGNLSDRMRRTLPLILVLMALAGLAGCGGSGSDSQDVATGTNGVAGSTTTVPAQAPNATEPARARSGAKSRSPYVVVTSLLGKPMPEEPECRFAKTFVPDNPSAAHYDGALTLTVTCDDTGGYRGTGQIVNRAGSKPTEITCRDTTASQLYCIYVPSPSVGLYFTGTDRAVVRRRLEHLMEVVAPLPTGITPLSGTSTR